MAYDEGLAERIREAVQGKVNVTEKKMFGGLAFMQDDYMFVGVNGEALMVRIGPDNQEAALAHPHVRDMDFTGRPMKGYVYVDPEGLESDEELQKWVDRASAFVAALPPKEPKKKRR